MSLIMSKEITYRALCEFQAQVYIKEFEPIKKRVACYTFATTLILAVIGGACFYYRVGNLPKNLNFVFFAPAALSVMIGLVVHHKRNNQLKALLNNPNNWVEPKIFFLYFCQNSGLDHNTNFTYSQSTPIAETVLRAHISGLIEKDACVLLNYLLGQHKDIVTATDIQKDAYLRLIFYITFVHYPYIDATAKVTHQYRPLFKAIVAFNEEHREDFHKGLVTLPLSNKHLMHMKKFYPLGS